MDNEEIRVFCKFVSICNWFWVLALAAGTVIAAVVWILAEVFLFIPSGTWTPGSICIGFLAAVLCIGVTMAALYGTALLWNEKEGGNGRYILFQVIAVFLAGFFTATGIVFNIYGAFSVWANVCYSVISIGVAVLNVIGFGLKRVE